MRWYKELYALYKQLHDAFGTKAWNGNLYGVMKKLIEIPEPGQKMILTTDGHR